jgi:hypothetical protein
MRADKKAKWPYLSLSVFVDSNTHFLLRSMMISKVCFYENHFCHMFKATSPLRHCTSSRAEH